MAHRQNRVSCAKTFRFSPALVEDMEHVLALAHNTKGVKYRSMTNLVVTAIEALIKRERRTLEDQGVAWEHLRPSKPINQEDQ